MSTKIDKCAICEMSCRATSTRDKQQHFLLLLLLLPSSLYMYMYIYFLILRTMNLVRLKHKHIKSKWVKTKSTKVNENKTIKKKNLYANSYVIWIEMLLKQHQTECGEKNNQLNELIVTTDLCEYRRSTCFMMHSNLNNNNNNQKKNPL